MNKDLQQAYRNCDYFIDDEIGFWQINIGDCDRTLSRYLHSFTLPTAAFISVYNPMAKPVKSSQINQRHQQLIKTLTKHNLSFCQGFMLNPQQGDSKQPSVFITNINKQQLTKLAAEFQQNAFVWVDEEGSVSVVK